MWKYNLHQRPFQYKLLICSKRKNSDTLSCKSTWVFAMHTWFQYKVYKCTVPTQVYRLWMAKVRAGIRDLWHEPFPRLILQRINTHLHEEYYASSNLLCLLVWPTWLFPPIKLTVGLWGEKKEGCLTASIFLLLKMKRKMETWPTLFLDILKKKKKEFGLGMVMHIPVWSLAESKPTLPIAEESEHLEYS